MVIVLEIGLAVSLGGPMLLMLVAKKMSFNTFSLSFRLLLWLLALIALVLAAFGDGLWRTHIGARSFSWAQLLGAVIATVAILGVFPVLQCLQKALGGIGSERTETFQKIAGLSVPHRVFLVITAAVVEELFYRGYAIGIGQYVFGNLAVAFIVSLLAFIVVHFRWGLSHLLSVFWATLVLSLLFLITKNLFACILAHFVVDAFGFLLLPSVIARQQARKAWTVHEG